VQKAGGCCVDKRKVCKLIGKKNNIQKIIVFNIKKDPKANNFKKFVLILKKCCKRERETI